MSLSTLSYEVSRPILTLTLSRAREIVQSASRQRCDEGSCTRFPTEPKGRNVSEITLVLANHIGAGISVWDVGTMPRPATKLRRFL